MLRGGVSNDHILSDAIVVDIYISVKRIMWEIVMVTEPDL